jgi:hypothetical protein
MYISYSTETSVYTLNAKCNQNLLRLFGNATCGRAETTGSLCVLFFIANFFYLYTIGRTPWMSDRPVASPLPKYRTTQTQNNLRKHIHTTSMP